MSGIPTYDDFKQGLANGDFQDRDLDVLDAFLRAPGHLLTSTELAQALGSFSGHRYGNLLIGGLGSRLADAMSFTPNVRKSDGTFQFWNVVASGHDRDGDQHFVFTMHDDLVAALRQFPSIRPDGRPALDLMPVDERPELTDEQQRRIAERMADRRRDRKL